MTPMFFVALCTALTVTALGTMLSHRRVSPRGRIVAGAFLVVMLAVDAWAVHVVRTDPDALSRKACGWVDGKRGWHQVCL